MVILNGQQVDDLRVLMTFSLYAYCGFASVYFRQRMSACHSSFRSPESKIACSFGENFNLRISMGSSLSAQVF